MHSIRRHPPIYLIYGYCTLGVAALFIGFYLFEEQLNWWQAGSERVLPIVLGGYLALAITNIIQSKHQYAFRLNQFLVNQLLEMLIMGLLMIYITPNQKDLAVVLLFHVGIGNLVLSKRYGYLLAAMATIMVLTQSFLHPLSIATDRVLSGSFICILFFAEAMITQMMRSNFKEVQSEAKQTQAKLDSSAKLNDLIIERMHTGVCLINNAGHVIRVNRAAQERIPSLILNQFIPEPLFERFKYWQEYHLQNENEISITLNDNRNPVFIYFASIDNDSTLIFMENKETVMRKAHQFKLNSLARMAASIAHEIRNPLNAISHASQLLGENDDLLAEDKRLCDIIFNHCQRMDGIIDNVMQISKRKPSKLKWIELHQWLLNTTDELSKQLDCAVTIEGEKLDVRFDPSQLHQILLNLMQNAVRYADANMTVGVSIELLRVDNRPCLRFRDFGPGLSDTVLRYLYEPFHTTSADGTGLGLYLIKELCEANHAEIHYDQHVKSGASFEILFAHDFEKYKDTP